MLYSAISLVGLCRHLKSTMIFCSLVNHEGQNSHQTPLPEPA